MARYIDADLLMKEFCDFVRPANNSDFAPVPIWNDAVSLVGSAPTADVVEVVRCKYCTHHEDIPYTTNVWCEKVERLLPEDWFCADGEKKERNNRQSRRKGENRI